MKTNTILSYETIAFQILHSKHSKQNVKCNRNECFCNLQREHINYAK